jgi:hypothetical protein
MQRASFVIAPIACHAFFEQMEFKRLFRDNLLQIMGRSRTSNPIESAFATIRHKTKRTKGCLSRDDMLH